jgi:hypothetical protein
MGTQNALFRSGELVSFAPEQSNAMTLTEARKHIKACADEMGSLYGRPVFDEWAIVLIAEGKGWILDYTGPRRGEFQKNFLDDAATLRGELDPNRLESGNFEFTRHGSGTRFDAFLVLGKNVFLICNHTGSSMSEITKESRWLNAQRPFVALSERFQSDPLTSSA